MESCILIGCFELFGYVWLSVKRFCEYVVRVGVCKFL